MTCEAFVQRVMSIAGQEPVYRTGGDGSDGTCDCIGLIMGALGGAYPLHSTNYFARFQTRDLRPLTAREPLRAGWILFKARGDEGTLHERYRDSGRYDTGDRLDYYHAGVVVQTEPLLIVHCTQRGGAGGIARDTAPDDWHYAGLPAAVREEADGARGTEAVVRAGSGSSVNLRAAPSLTAPRLARVPLDTVVRILGTEDGWAQIRTPDGLTGYMMRRYLSSALPELEKRLAALEARVAALETT